jgi:hypothetical protein
MPFGRRVIEEDIPLTQDSNFQNGAESAAKHEHTNADD